MKFLESVSEQERAAQKGGLAGWLVAFAAAGLCYFAWRTQGETGDLHAEIEADIRNLRDEYARLERERAAMHVRIEELQTQLAALQGEATEKPASSRSRRARPVPPASASQNSRGAGAGSNGAYLNGSTPLKRSARSRKPPKDATGENSGAA